MATTPLKTGIATSLALALLAGCTLVGPDYEASETAVPEQWLAPSGATEEAAAEARWWHQFDDPVLHTLIERAGAQNLNLQVAGLRVLEAQALLGIAEGNRWPQAQALSGGATYGRTGGIDVESYSLSAAAAWELDFWGKYARAIESADASLLASLASYDDLAVINQATVASTYVAIRTLEEQLRITHENIALQQRSYEIVEVLYRNGESAELDMQQAHTLLLSTQSAIPQLETALAQARNALSLLLGELPGQVETELACGSGLPKLIGAPPVLLPADMLRLRPDVREAELRARAQNAQVGVARANLYPSFSIAGSIGLSAEGAASTTDLGDLFDSDALSYGLGPSFVWPFLNYERLQNNVRVQDARLQQRLLQYRQTVLAAVREVEDALTAVNGARELDLILAENLASAQRSADLATLRYQEGFSDYQRVLDANRALFNQQERFISNRGAAVASLITLHRALGGGWRGHDHPLVSAATQEEMEQRTDWDAMIDASRELRVRDPAYRPAEPTP